MTIAEIQAFAEEVKKQNGWHEKTACERFTNLTSEVGEVANEVIKYTWAQKPEIQDAARQAIGDELYDVVWNVCDLANIVGLDLTKSFEAKAAEYKKRDWAQKGLEMYGKEHK